MLSLAQWNCTGILLSRQDLNLGHQDPEGSLSAATMLPWVSLGSHHRCPSLHRDSSLLPCSHKGRRRSLSHLECHQARDRYVPLFKALAFQSASVKLAKDNRFPSKDLSLL